MTDRCGDDGADERSRRIVESHQPAVVMPEQAEGFTRLLKFLKFELVHIRLKWRVYQAFYGTNTERLDLLNSVSGTTAVIIQDALYNDVILSLCRLGDRASSRGRANNSYKALLEMLEEGPLKFRLSELIREFGDMCKPLISRRNWFVAHSDRRAVFDGAGEGVVSGPEVDSAIEAARSVLTFIYSEMFDTMISTEVVSHYAHDEVVFLRTLYHGKNQLSHLEANALAKLNQPGDPRQTPPEFAALREIREMPEWLNYRPPEKRD
ncbi:hypothetical protein [Paracoccus homiensis]|uniref:AbiU2 domain-containing protein n=1 Tax=Paracoccus homiensis TaxID=364199 RepID=UPI00398D36E5